jgi:hypothetical protein
MNIPIEEKKWLSMWELGQVFGVGLKVVGGWLEARNLVNSRRSPTEFAISTGYSDLKPDWQGIYRWYWNRKLIDEFTEAGHIRPDQPITRDAVALHGPFITRLVGDGDYEIVGADNVVSVRVAGKENAAFVLRLLNLAHTCGKV